MEKANKNKNISKEDTILQILEMAMSISKTKENEVFQERKKEYAKRFENMFNLMCPIYQFHHFNGQEEPYKCMVTSCMAFEGYVDEKRKVVVLPHCKLMHEDY